MDRRGSTVLCIKKKRESERKREKGRKREREREDMIYCEYNDSIRRKNNNSSAPSRFEPLLFALKRRTLLLS